MAIENLNLDELEYQEITLHGTVYKFRVPPVEQLQGIVSIEEKTAGIEDPKQVMEIIATEVNKAVPELPVDELKSLSGKQLKHLIVYIVGSDMDSVNMLLRKKK